MPAWLDKNGPDLVWGLLIVVALTLELVAVFTGHDRYTLSWRIRDWLDTKTSKGGRVVWLIGWSGFGVWMLLHILQIGGF